MRAGSLTLGAVGLAVLLVAVFAAPEDPDAKSGAGGNPLRRERDLDTLPGPLVATDAAAKQLGGVPRAEESPEPAGKAVDGNGSRPVVGGLVEDSHGAPVDSATVWLWNHPRRAVWHRRGSPSRLGPTSAVGEFLVELRGDEYLVEASDGAHSCVLAWQGAATDGTTPVVVVASATVWRGDVIQEGGSPIPSARLTITPAWNVADVVRRSAPLDVHHRVPTPRRIWPGRDGRFEIRLATGRRYRVSVTAPGCRMLEKSVCFADAQVSSDLVLGPGITIRGQVLGAGFATLAGARVELIGNDACTARSDGSGRFSLSGADPVADSWIGVTAEGHAPVVVRARIGEGVSIALRRGVTLTGRVVDGLGKPIALAPLLLLRPDDGIHAMARRWLHERLANAMTTDEQGRFTIPNLLPVVHELMVRDPVSPSLSHKQKVYVGSRAAVLLVLDRNWARAVVMRGVVRDARTNRPIPAFTVLPKLMVSGLLSWTPRSFDSDDGTFEIIGLRPGVRKIEVKASGYRTRSLPVREFAVGTHLVDVFLKPDDM